MILKVSRSPLRTLKEADISQKMEPVGKLRRSSRRVSFAETKEIKEFVTDKMMMIMQDVENGKDSLKENQSAELERDLMPQNTNYSIAGMDALLHAPLRIPLQQIEHCEHIKTVSKHQNFPISGVEIQRDLEETVQSSAITAVTTHSQKIDFKSFLAGIDSTEQVYTTVCFDTENENANKSFSSTRQNEVPKQQKTIDFKTFLNSIKQSDTDQNKMTSMTSIFEEQIMKQKDTSVLSACGTVKNVGTTKDLTKINSNNNLDSNKTVLFLDQDNDMELTRSHTVAINHFALGNVTTLHSTTVSNNVEGLGTESSTHSPFSQYKTVSPSVEDDMDLTRCHPASIDVRRVELLTNQNQLAAVSIQKEDKSIMPSFTPHEDKLFSDNRCCGKIDQNEALVASKLSSKSVPDLSSFPSDKTIIFSEANDMDITKSHLVTIDSRSLGRVGNEVKGSDKYTLRQSTAGSVLSFFPNDETMVFSEANDMDITKSHTVTIDDKITGQVASEVLGFTRMISGLTLPGSILPPFSNDKTVVFSEANDMDITKSHTITIDNGSIDRVENEASTKLISRWSTVRSLSSHFPSDKTILFSEANDMDLTKSHSVPIDNGKFGATANSFFPSGRTVVLSDANDMDITKSHTIQIDSENARQNTAGTLAPKKLSLRSSTAASVLSSFPNDKTVVFSEANDMDITKSHTVAIECENLGTVVRPTVGPDKKICIENATVPILSTFSNDKTLVFSEANDMDITKSHTVTIDNGNLGQVRNEAFALTRMSSKHSVPESAASIHSNRTSVFSKANDVDITKSHTVAIESGNLQHIPNEALGSMKLTSVENTAPCAQPSFSSKATLGFSETTDMDLTKSHTAIIESENLGLVARPIEKPDKKNCVENASVPIRSSFPNDKTLVFSEANDMDITKSHTVTINGGDVGQVTNEALGFRRMTSKHSVSRSISSFLTDKTVVFSEANDMDITKSHTVAIESENLGPIAKHAEGSEANDMDITKSHIVTIDGGNLGPVVNWTESLCTSFPHDKTLIFSDTNDMDITKNHTVPIISGNIGKVRNEDLSLPKVIPKLTDAGSSLSSFPRDKFTGSPGAKDMDITKSQIVAIESENLGPVARPIVGPDKKLCIGNASMPSLSTFPNDKTLVFSEANDMDITKSYTVTINGGDLGQVSNEALGFRRMTSKHHVPQSISSFCSDKTVVFSEANDMDITKSHTVAIESENLGPVARPIVGPDKKICIENATVSILSTFPNDKTLVFSEANDMDITKSHTVTIDNGNLGQVRKEAFALTRMSSKDSLPESAASIHSNRTSVFSKANDMDITKSHTVAIECGNLQHIPNEALGSMKLTSVENTAPCAQPSFSSKATLGFSETTDMDLTKSHTAIIESENLGLVARPKEKPDKKICVENASVPIRSSFPNDKTLVFSEANDMDITKSHTVTINGGDLGQVTNEALGFRRMTSKHHVPQSISSFCSDKTVVFSEANDMDITKSHTVAIESENLGHVARHTVGSAKKTSVGNASISDLSSFPNNKILAFSEANDMDITESHTVPVVSGSIGEVRNEDLSLPRMIPKLMDAGSSPLSFPRDKFTRSSEANNMDITKNHTVAAECDGFVSAISESLGSDNMTSRFTAHGSVLPPFPKDKNTVSEQVTPVREIGGVSISNKCAVSSNRQLFQLELEKRQKCSGNLSSNVKFVNIQTTVENTACNVNQAVHTVGTSDPSTRSVEITVLNTEGETEEDGECVSSMCVNEKLNRKEIKESVLSKGNSLDPILKGNNDLEAQEILCQVNQSREAASEELVRHQVSDTQTGNNMTDVIEYENTANKHMGLNQSRKSSLANMQSLQKLNTVTNVTYDSVSERPPVGEKGSSNDQTLDAKSRLLKQSSLINSTFKYNLSLGIFPPKLPIRENLYKAVSSNHQHVAKSFGDHLGSDSLLSTMYKSNKFEVDSDKLRLNIDLKKPPDIQNKSQVTDHDHKEKIFDQSEPSLSLKSPDLTCLDISEQLGKEPSASSEQNENVMSSQGAALGGLKMIKSVEEKLYHKRSWSEVEENRNSCSKKKMRNLGPEDTDSSSQKANNAPVVQWEGMAHKVVEENQLSMMTKSLDSNSSLDSTKGDGASADVANSKCNLNTSLVILEESELHEKLMDGQITVREFFKLLKVQTHAQKSRQSELHVNVELDKSSTVENWLAVKFVHRPKREVYEEDSCALSAAIAELKDQLLDLDKLLSEVNPSLWKDVMEMTEEELRQFRSCLNAKKSTFVKKTKAICHEQKVELYSAQLNMFKEQRQQRSEYEAYLDDILHKMDDCLASLDLANLDHLGESSADVIDNDDSITQLEQTVRDRREELKKLQAEYCEVESQLTKVLNEKELQEKAANVWDLKEEFQELLEWTLCLCQDDQAVYKFLYDSLELTLNFGEPVLVDLSPGAKCKRILDINLVSALDEDEAPLHSKLVHELIMTYWKSQDSWQDVYTNELQLPMLLLDVSLVVSRCRLLGDELEYLMNWGSKFDILKTEVQNMDVKCLFSSYDALSKFELTFHIKPGYPWHLVQFTFNSWFGNISGEHINEVLLTVKPGPKYLTKIVKSLYLTLLVKPGANRFRLQHSSP
ncbi:kinetochore scaffold 1 isoform X2 [Hemiscyllium ocellatum]|uniref:kinetochore scaffold 1 isoform X2 n=1 Tax=Hemiscyllium ocellatum TaxID=170820 RepID=UPI0029671C13|nr:kinetochore scaffold 1 isoform X2 [Hemiscyllium ocellatum]XP_060684747.1 kinetochore scaffold 1 isoform X2 [Hemiscyllium ocellatum]